MTPGRIISNTRPRIRIVYNALLRDLNQGRIISNIRRRIRIVYNKLLRD